MSEDELENILEGIDDDETRTYFDPDEHPPIPCNSEFLENVKKLTKDINNAAKQMTDQEARYLIDLYKILQKIRIHSENQIRSM